MTERLIRYYETFDEWGRLETPEGLLEYERTFSYLEKYFPKTGRVLDLGGGPGRYAIGMAERGYTVWLADLSRDLLEIAKQKIEEAGVSQYIEQVTQLHASDLSSLPDDTFDAALVLGPFYHLTRALQREKAVAELLRTMRRGAVALISFMPRLSALGALLTRAAADPKQVSQSVIERVLREGVFENPVERGFQQGYYPHLDEISNLFGAKGFKQVGMVSIRGLADRQEVAYFTLRRENPDLAVAYDRVLDETASQTAVIELSRHALLVVRKP